VWGVDGVVKVDPLAFLIAAGGSEIFAGGSTPQSPGKYSPACCQFPKNLPMHSQAFRPQTLPFRAVISQSRLTRPPPQTPTELTPLQAVRSRTHARTQSPAHRPTDTQSLQPAATASPARASCVIAFRDSATN